MQLNRIALLASLTLGCALVGGCHGNNHHESEAECKAIKPGTITTANKVCVMVNDDPVNPAVAPVEWKGQKYGLCCNGCRGKWNALTDAQKDEAVQRAVALSK